MNVLLCLFALTTSAVAFTCDHDAYLERNLPQDEYNLIHTTRILYPKAKGSYPVFVWLHGFDLTVQSYDKILCDAAKSNIVIAFQMKFRLVAEGLEDDAKLIKPYLHDETKGILPRIGSSKILPGYAYTDVGIGGHSRGGGVIAYGYSHSILKDGDFHGVAFIDPVIRDDPDVPNSVNLQKTIVRVLYFNDAKSVCVTRGWPDFGSKFSSSADLKVTNATSSGCKHMDVVSSWGSLLPICNSGNDDLCQEFARKNIAAAGFGPALSDAVAFVSV